jgi:PAS domain S-box-containing protein
LSAHDPVNILLVDDRPANLRSYEAVLSELGENLIKVSSVKEAFAQLLKVEIAVVLTDVNMPELDGFELAAMIRERPRFEATSIIFVSASQPKDVDLLRSYKSGAVDYIPVPVVPELLRAKVQVFVELYRKTRQLQQLNTELEQRVVERTAALAESKRQLQFLADHAPVLIAQCDSNGRYKFVNEPYANFFGFRPRDIIGRHAREVLGEHAYDHAAPHIEEALAGRRTEYDLELSDTRHGPRAVHVAYAPEFDTTGVVGWVAAIVDITERKQAEAKLAQLAAIIESSDDSIISTTLDGRIISWNAGAARIFGYKASEMIGQSITRIIPPERHGEEEQILARLKYGERIEHYETSRIAKDGQQIDVSLSVSPVHDKAGKMIGVSKVARDITERKRAEHAQRKSEALASAVYAAALDAVITIDHGGRVVEWNHAAEKVFGCSRSEALGREIAELIVPPRMREAHRRGIANYLTRGEGPVLGRLIEFPAMRADGTEFPTELYIVPIPNEGAPLFTGFVRDITQRKHAEAHLHLIMKELSHRTKNLMAVVQAISWQTAQTCLDLEDFEERFTQRLEALARSHDLLVKRDWRGVVLADLVRAQLEPFLDPSKMRVAVHGPTLLLMPEAAQDLGLALHELATNASKYGALSVPTGKIDIGWMIDDRGPAGTKRFLMTWRETGGPPTSVPARRGFGSTVITSTLATSFKGEARVEYPRQGLSWELAAALGHVVTELS